MYITALKLLNVCTEYPLGANFTTMMSSRAPKLYTFFFSIIYLLLLYSLLSAYTTQGSSLISTIGGVNEPSKSQIGISAIVFILIFAALMFSYKLSDYTNRIFVTLKLVFFIVATVIMLFYINKYYLNDMPSGASALIFAWPTLLPAFGFHNIIPVIYEYQKGDIKNIKRSILIGSISVLIIYIVWVFLSLGVLPQHGLFSYHVLFLSGDDTPSGLVEEIKAISESNALGVTLNLFIHIAVITSFIGVGISMMHYIRDLFIRYNKHVHSLVVALICFIPPLIFTVFYPRGFILALQYAAIFAVIIFVYTPTFLSARKDLKVNFSHIYAVSMGSAVILFEIFNLCFDTNPYVG
ncbi:amino acid transporter [Francisella halioticida]|nr:amino acid transporter [Francisella halioticida]